MVVSDLASQISDFVMRATEFENTRELLVRKISQVVNEEIVPQLIPLLPRRYSIDPNRTRVQMNPTGSSPCYGIQSVPAGFDVRLRLLYDGQPIYGSNDKRFAEAGKIQISLRPKLEELAQAYNLRSIIPMAESLQV